MSPASPVLCSLSVVVRKQCGKNDWITTQNGGSIRAWERSAATLTLMSTVHL